MTTTLLALLLGTLQDPADLVRKLGSADAVEADNAQEDLLRLGNAAVDPVRKALEGTPDAALKRRATGILERLEVRTAASGIAARWGDRWYSLLANNVHLGWAHMKAELKDGKAVFQDDLYVKFSKDAELTVKASFTCGLDEYLSVQDFTLDISAPDRTLKATAKRKEDRLLVTTDGELKGHKVRPRLVPDLVLMRLVTLLPKSEGYTVDLLETVNPALREGLVLRQAAEEILELSGKQVKTRRFESTDSEGNLRVYWVDAEGRLVKSSFRGGEIEAQLVSEDKARDLDTGN